MAKLIISRRVIFPKNKQKEFILNAKSKLNLSWTEFSVLLGISVRNLTDWKNEKISLSAKAVEIICKKIGVDFPRDVELKDPYWYVNKGASKGGKATYKKYGTIGDPEKRKKKWREWWNTKGKYLKRKINQPIPFKKPEISSELAEFAGIMLGDGGITKNQISVTLHCFDDIEYSKYIIKLIESIFDLTPVKYNRKNSNAFDIKLSRVLIVKFCVEDLGLCMGNKVKQCIDVPLWIKNKKTYKLACLRGLIDTDGSIILHRYKSKGKVYYYRKISFCNRSFPLLKSVGSILDEFNIKNRLTKNNYEIRIEAQKEVDKYFNLVGSHNPKHLKKYKNKL